MFEQQPVLETIQEEKEVPCTPLKETTKSQNMEDCNSTDEGTFASPSSCASDSEAPSAQSCEGSPGPSSSCTSDDENGHSGQEADVDSSSSGLNSSCASDDEDGASAPLAKLPSVGSVGHYAGQCSRCCFFPKGRCTNGENCNFCHLDHERVRRKRGGAKKAAKAAEEAENSSTLEPKVLFEEDAAAKELKSAEPEVPVVDPAFSRSSLQAKGETVINGMMKATVANMPLMHPGVNTSMQLPQVPQIPTPQCTRNKAPIAEQLTSKLLAVSAGRPVKVWLPPDVAPLKRLDASIPAKKKPSFAEYASDKKKTLDPSMPCKKHMPSWLVNLDSVPQAPKPKPQTFAPAPPAPVMPVEPAPR